MTAVAEKSTLWSELEQTDCETLPDWDQAWLRSSARPEGQASSVIPVADVFSGCGGMTLGLEEAARRGGFGIKVKLALDSDPASLNVYKRNFSPSLAIDDDAASVFGGEPGSELTEQDRALAAEVGRLAILCGGPPCVGHSDLNNQTRRSDPRNALYLTMARAAEVLKPGVVVIENVPAVQHDKDRVVDATTQALIRLGYRVDGKVINSLAAGVPQRRRRYVVVGSVISAVDPTEVLNTVTAAMGDRIRTVAWAIRDLADVTPTLEIDKPARMSEANLERARYLHESGRLDLPNERRPTCHRDDPAHSYKSMYGRLSWDRPAQTITTGFSSMGQGRYVHPAKPRTLTPHEAARLQTFPDWFEWSESARTELSSMIGNAVPPLLMLAVATPIIKALSNTA